VAVGKKILHNVCRGNVLTQGGEPERERRLILLVRGPGSDRWVTASACWGKAGVGKVLGTQVLGGKEYRRT